MPITTPRDGLLAGLMLPDEPTMCAALTLALDARRVPSADEAFTRDIVAAARANRATESQLNWLERLWIRFCDTRPLPDDVDAGCAAVTRHAMGPLVPANRREFMHDIVRAVRGRAPSEPQWRAFLGLVTEAERARPVPEAPVADGRPAAVVTNAERLFALFDTAQRAPVEGRVARMPRLQFPGLNVWRATDGSDAVMFSRPHAEPNRRTRLARLLRDGTITGGFASRGSLLSEDQVALVQRLCTNPEETLADMGRRTGTCCMCGRGLTDARSVNLGMGPVCAGRWGLSTAWLAAADTVPGAGAHTPRGPRMANAPDIAARRVHWPQDYMPASTAAPAPRVPRGEPGWMLADNQPDQEDF